MLYKSNIIFYHSNVKNKIDKKYDDEFKDLLRYYKKYTTRLNEFDYKKEKLIQDTDSECNIKYPHYIKFHYETYFTFDDKYDEPYIYDCLLY